MERSVESLGEWIAEQAAHLDAATHRLLTAVREFDAAGGWYAQGGIAPLPVLIASDVSAERSAGTERTR